jgi:prepilin-type N-terminal cleavage/methylation domain-containing protein
MKQYNNLTIEQFNTKKGFTLVEVMVAVTVFSLVVVAAGGSFFSVRQSWQRQRDTIDLIQNARWAMELMSNEIRQARATTVSVGLGGNRLRFRIDPDADGNPPFRQIEYRRQGTVLYRRWGQIPGVWQPYRELANLIINNPSGNQIFNWDAITQVLTIELTVERNNRRYTLRTQVRPRN